MASGALIERSRAIPPPDGSKVPELQRKTTIRSPADDSDFKRIRAIPVMRKHGRSGR
jgi:hypothetical protein